MIGPKGSTGLVDLNSCATLTSRLFKTQYIDAISVYGQPWKAYIGKQVGSYASVSRLLSSSALWQLAVTAHTMQIRLFVFREHTL